MSIWFPVPPGTTTLPPAPNIVVNNNPVPAFSTPTPNNFDPDDLDELFNNILPTAGSAVFKKELSIDGVTSNIIKPYAEKIKIIACIKAKLDVVEYAIPLDQKKEVVCTVKTKTVLSDDTKDVDPIFVKTKISSIIFQTFPYIKLNAFVKTGISVEPIRTSAGAILLHMDGATGSNVFYDSGQDANWTVNNATITDSLFRIRGSSGSFVNFNSYLTRTSANHNIGSGDFTISLWLYVPQSSWTSTSYKRYLYAFGPQDGNYTNGLFYTIAVSRFYSGFVFGDFSTQFILEDVTYNEWINVRFVKYSNTYNLYVNGESIGSGEDLTTYSNETHYIGGNGVIYSSTESGSAKAYLDEVYLVKGIPLTTADSFVVTDEEYEPVSRYTNLKPTIKTGISASLIYNNAVNNVIIATKTKLIINSGVYNSVLTYTGTGSSSTQALTGLPFAPFFAIIKARTGYAYPLLHDRLQGNGKFYTLYTSSNQQTQSGGSTTLDDNGITVYGSEQNTLSVDYLAWCLDAKYYTSVDNAQYTGTVYRNLDIGFSSVKWTKKATSSPLAVEHNLPQRPEIVFYRLLDQSQYLNFISYKLGTENLYGIFAGNFTLSASSNVSTNSSNVSFNTYSYSLQNSIGIMYAFSSVSGRTKINTYNGTGGSSNFIETGFKPGTILIKAVAGGLSTGFLLYDVNRGFSQQTDLSNTTAETDVGTKVTVSSNGFTVEANSDINTDGVLFLYMAFRGASQLYNSFFSPSSHSLTGNNVSIVRNYVAKVESGTISTIGQSIQGYFNLITAEVDKGDFSVTGPSTTAVVIRQAVLNGATISLSSGNNVLVYTPTEKFEMLNIFEFAEDLLRLDT